MDFRTLVMAGGGLIFREAESRGPLQSEAGCWQEGAAVDFGSNDIWYPL